MRTMLCVLAVCVWLMPGALMASASSMTVDAIAVRVPLSDADARHQALDQGLPKAWKAIWQRYDPMGQAPTILLPTLHQMVHKVRFSKERMEQTHYYAVLSIDFYEEKVLALLGGVAQAAAEDAALEAGASSAEQMEIYLAPPLHGQWSSVQAIFLALDVVQYASLKHYATDKRSLQVSHKSDAKTLARLLQEKNMQLFWQGCHWYLQPLHAKSQVG